MSEGQIKKTTSFAYGYEWVFENFKFIAFLVLLGVFYISNAHSAEKHLREIEVLKREIKEKQTEFYRLKSNIVKGSSMSQMQAKMKGKEIDLKGRFPRVIKDKK